MQKIQDQIDKLLLFRQLEKFSTKAWNDRGLNPSPEDLCIQLNGVFNSCSDKLVACLNTNPTNRKLKETIRKTLFSLNKLDYDTEEKEFICDLFYELAAITEVDINNDLNKWLYGSLSTTISKLGKFLTQSKNKEIISQPCSKCGNKLESYIIEKEKGIPDSSWFIIKCSTCNELNLLSQGPDIRELKFGNYEWVETLSKDQYNYDQALTRLEQIKVFRK